MTSLQQHNERLRDRYKTYPMPLLAYLVKIHGISVRDFAGIMEISKNHAEAVLKHRVFPSLELAIRIARYFELTVEDIFGWRLDDFGERRPLLVEIPGKGWARLKHDSPLKPSLSLAAHVASGGKK